jgi:hypothetical protein
MFFYLFLQVTLGSRTFAVGGYSGANVVVVEEYNSYNNTW